MQAALVLTCLTALAIASQTEAQKEPSPSLESQLEKLLSDPQPLALELPPHRINIPHITVGKPSDLMDELLEEFRQLHEPLDFGFGHPFENPAKPPIEDGAHRVDYEDGSPRELGAHQNTRRHGSWQSFHANGLVESEGLYVHGKKHGVWTEWTDTGVVLSSGEYSYDRREGLWIDYHPNGLTRQIAVYVDGHLDGLVERWFENGVMQSESRYSYGTMHGRWNAWFQDGRPACNGTYHYGQHVGRWLYYDSKTGALDTKKSGRYENGARVDP